MGTVNRSRKEWTNEITNVLKERGLNWVYAMREGWRRTIASIFKGVRE